MADVVADDLRSCVEKSRHPQVRDEHHHAEEQHQGAEVDMPVGIVERGDAGGDHQRRANDGGARAIDFEERCAAESQDEVSEEENGAGDDRRGHACAMVHRTGVLRVPGFVSSSSLPSP